MLAVARFRSIVSASAGRTVALPVVPLDSMPSDLLSGVPEEFEEETIMAWAEAATTPTLHPAHVDGREYIGAQFPEAGIWAFFRAEVIKNPKRVAQLVGIEQIGYLTDLKPPTLSPKLADLITLYAEKPGVSKAEIRAVTKQNRRVGGTNVRGYQENLYGLFSGRP